MKESKFIQSNKEKWQNQEKGILNNTLNAEEMEKTFIELNDDLAYAQTFYRNRSIKVFLNNLLAPVYSNIYKGKKWNLKTVKNFFFDEAPLVIYHSRTYILISFVTVMLGLLLGYFGAKTDSDFITTILGPDYVRITESNIAKGDPLAIYKMNSPSEMFYMIGVNNLKVAFYFFVFGIFFCIGTLYLLFNNGIMLGVFTYMFTSRGLGTEYLLTVYQHGTLEILGMVMEGAAGIMLGAGIFFPGTYSRMKSIQDKAKKSITLLIVCVPIILLAAFIESYLTRFTEINTFLRAAIILLSFAFMLYYFVIYPWLRYRGARAVKSGETIESETELLPQKNKMYSVGNTLLFAINYLKNNFERVAILSLISALGIFWLANYVSGYAITEDVQFEMRNWKTLFSGGGNENALLGVFGMITKFFKFVFFNVYASKYIFDIAGIPALALPCFIILFFSLYLSVIGLSSFFSENIHKRISKIKILLNCLAIAILITLLNYITGNMWWMNMLFIFPFAIILLTITLCFGPDKNLLSSLPAAIKVYFGSFWRIVGSILVIFLLFFVIMFGFWLISTLIIMQTSGFHGNMNLMSKDLLLFYVRSSYFFMPIMLSLFVYQFCLITFSIYEKHYGKFLFESIADIKFKKEVYGVETE